MPNDSYKSDAAKSTEADEVPSEGESIEGTYTYIFDSTSSPFGGTNGHYEDIDPAELSCGHLRCDYFGPLPWMKASGCMEGLRRFCEEHPEVLEELGLSLDAQESDTQEPSQYQLPIMPDKTSAPPCLWLSVPNDHVH